MVKGTIRVIYGPGNGKSASAVGYGIIGALRNKKVIIVQYLKGILDEGGMDLLKRMEPEMKVFRFERSRGPFSELTEEQKKAFVTVKSVFRLDHLGFEYLYVNENFATFGIANGRASFIYSKSNQKPDFVNLAEITDKNRVYVEKITDNWFYACK